MRAAATAAGMLAAGGTLTLLHARPRLDVAAASDDNIDTAYASGVTAALEGLRSAMAASHTGITVDVERRDGEAAAAIMNFAIAGKADFWPSAAIAAMLSPTRCWAPLPPRCCVRRRCPCWCCRRLRAIEDLESGFRLRIRIADCDIRLKGRPTRRPFNRKFPVRYADP